MATTVTSVHRRLGIETHHWRAELSHVKLATTHRTWKSALNTAMRAGPSGEGVAHYRIRCKLLMVKSLLLLLQSLDLILDRELR